MSMLEMQWYSGTPSIITLAATMYRKQLKAQKKTSTPVISESKNQQPSNYRFELQRKKRPGSLLSAPARHRCHLSAPSSNGTPYYSSPCAKIFPSFACFFFLSCTRHCSRKFPKFSLLFNLCSLTWLDHKLKVSESWSSVRRCYLVLAILRC